jgi:hypothetical protein
VKVGVRDSVRYTGNFIVRSSTMCNQGVISYPVVISEVLRNKGAGRKLVTNDCGNCHDAKPEALHRQARNAMGGTEFEHIGSDRSAIFQCR